MAYLSTSGAPITNTRDFFVEYDPVLKIPSIRTNVSSTNENTTMASVAIYDESQVGTSFEYAVVESGNTPVAGDFNDVPG